MQITLQIKKGELVPVAGQMLWEDFKTKNDGELFTIEPVKKTRTSKQNKALHVYFQLLADALNDAGFDMKKVMRVDIPWTAYAIKEYLWKPVMKQQLGKESTKDLETKEIDQVYDSVNRAVGERTQIHVPFPSNEPDTYEL